SSLGHFPPPAPAPPPLYPLSLHDALPIYGVLGTPDVIEDLLLLGALDDKVVLGSMNRGGVEGAVFEFDDRFTAYDTEAIVSMGRSEEHTSELQSRENLVCRLLLEKKKRNR